MSLSETLSAAGGLTKTQTRSPFHLGAEALAAAGEDFRRQGFAVIGPGPGLIRAEVFAALRQEAREQRAGASWPLKTGDGRSRTNEDSVRGHFGPIARALMSAPQTVELMWTVTGEKVAPSWSASCFTWYDKPGAWLGRHHDKPDACYLTMILGLESAWPVDQPPPPGNQLWVFDSLKAEHPRHILTTRPNRAVIIDGKRWPHERPPLGEGQAVSVLCGCFRHDPAGEAPA